MWKYNIHSIGEVVVHNEAPTLEFQICDILRAKNENYGNYLYCCRIVDNQNDDAELFNYQGVDLSFIRKGTEKELNLLLKKAVKEEYYELAEAIKIEMDQI